AALGLQPIAGTLVQCNGRRRRRCWRGPRVDTPRRPAANAAIRAVVRDGKLSLRRHVGLDPRSSPRDIRRQPDSPGAVSDRWRRQRTAPVELTTDEMEPHNRARVRKMWAGEVEAAATYRHLADRERAPNRRQILIRLADQEDRHAARWSDRIAAATGHAPD